MKIVDLSPEYEAVYFKCLEDWSDEMAESGDHKACWYQKMKDKGLIVKLALDDEGKAGGMIQAIPIEDSVAEGENLYFIPCTWVHGYKKGRGNFQKKGMGKALLGAVEDEVRRLGKYGLVAWGLALPFWMKASWYKKQGFRTADRKGIALMVWKPFHPDAQKPRWIKRRRKPVCLAGVVTVTGFINGACPAGNITFERAKRAAAAFGDRVRFEKIDTSNRETFLEWGLSDSIYIDNKEITNGPPLSYEKILKKIRRQLKKRKLK